MRISYFRKTPEEKHLAVFDVEAWKPEPLYNLKLFYKEATKFYWVAFPSFKREDKWVDYYSFTSEEKKTFNRMVVPKILELLEGKAPAPAVDNRGVWQDEIPF